MNLRLVPNSLLIYRGEQILRGTTCPNSTVKDGEYTDNGSIMHRPQRESTCKTSNHGHVPCHRLNKQPTHQRVLDSPATRSVRRITVPSTSVAATVATSVATSTSSAIETVNVSSFCCDLEKG